jgi:ribosomal protein S18 acetylase RimI-like enzyme
MNGIELRPAVADDYPAISRLVTSPQELFLVFPAGRYPFTVKQVRFLAEKRSDLTVVTDHAEVVGFANLYDIKAGQWAFVGNLILKQQYRGKGIGRRLTRYMLHRVFDLHRIPEARISVFADNAAAHALYTRLGFKTYAKEQRLDLEHRPVTLLHMRLPVSFFAAGAASS